MDYVGIGIVRATSPEWLRIPKPVRADHTQLLVIAAIRERGGVIPNARQWTNRDWDRAGGMTRRAVESVVDHALASWVESDLHVEHYPIDVERRLARRRSAQKKATEAAAATAENRARSAESLGSDEHNGQPHGGPARMTQIEVKGSEGKRSEAKDQDLVRTPLESDRVPDLSKEAYRLADYLRRKILGAKPDHRIGKGSHSETKWTLSAKRRQWAQEADRMHRLDHRDWRRSGELIAWVYGPNLGGEAQYVVESVKALRDKWDRLDVASRPRAARAAPSPEQLLAGYDVGAG